MNNNYYYYYFINIIRGKYWNKITFR